jgi:hypothetical protein
LSADSNVVLRSNLEYTDMSAKYARSIYSGVREILNGFLASNAGGRTVFSLTQDKRWI